MKKIIIFLCLGLFLCFPVLASDRNVQDNHKIIYHVLNTTGQHVSGQTVSLSIQKVSNSYFFDFSDSTFKASGWTSKTVTMTDDSTNGFYYYLFNPPATETGTNEYLFVVDNTNATYADHRSELVSYLDFSKFRGR